MPSLPSPTHSPGSRPAAPRQSGLVAYFELERRMLAARAGRTGAGGGGAAGDAGPAQGTRSKKDK